MFCISVAYSAFQLLPLCRINSDFRLTKAV
nr:MAG TPA: hypothetical protein [Caudoviricetes sp.]